MKWIERVLFVLCGCMAAALALWLLNTLAGMD
jgi:hypothetical protein